MTDEEAEYLEDLALIRAMEEVEGSPLVSRSEVMRILSRDNPEDEPEPPPAQHSR